MGIGYFRFWIFDFTFTENLSIADLELKITKNALLSKSKP